MTTTVWSANTSLSVNTIVAPTESNRVAGLFFKVTVAGTTGLSEPNWPNTIKEFDTVNEVTRYITVYDNDIQYVPLNAVFSDLQPISPSAIIELFTLTFNYGLHYNLWENNRTYELGDVVSSSNSNASKTIVFKCTTAGQSGNSEPSGFASASSGSTISDNQVVWTAQGIDIYRFHAGSNLDANGEIVWAGNSYLRFPVTAEGFAFQRGQLPRPKLIVSNATGLISAILEAVNLVTVGNDLTGATVTRIRTMAKFIDAVNFPDRDSNNNPVNPLGTPDPTAEFKREIYTIDRKATENREVVEFELAAVFDLAGIRAPKRQCTRSLFPSIGTFTQ